ncbi:MAG: hypothetical protein HY248_06020 [Fimbriimonas ginsengisoli]|uniref:Uncharacterized protein n=1 Tax=Fimbriimonas ginsengisoli TaxID=1005039 RepID=A0A931LTB1_FIMGI|nr:hypothetical protein [Fimbriimonas ginsengisoli]MBI3722093.1 hypothetical protein [Fimbriimonas ginsengisoli]
MPKPKDVDQETHVALAKFLFNGAWKLIGLEERTPEQVETMLHTAHAARYHWAAAGGGPQQLAVSDWQLARVYALAGDVDRSRHYAVLCLDRALENGLEPWVEASAHEAFARAAKVAGDKGTRRAEIALADAALTRVTDAEDRSIIENDLRDLRD